MQPVSACLSCTSSLPDSGTYRCRRRRVHVSCALAAVCRASMPGCWRGLCAVAIQPVAGSASPPAYCSRSGHLPTNTCIRVMIGDGQGSNGTEAIYQGSTLTFKSNCPIGNRCEKVTLPKFVTSCTIHGAARGNANMR